jgi:hypothetical protein
MAKSIGPDCNTVEDIAIMQTPTWLKWPRLLELTATITGVAHADMKKERRRDRKRERIKQKKQEISVG